MPERAPAPDSLPLPDLAQALGRPPRVLVTGAGGPAAVCFLRGLGESCELFAADIDPNAVGLYLVDREHRWLLPRGDDPDFTGALLDLCTWLQIDVAVPTVDVEMVPLARESAAFEEAGVRLLLSPAEALENCLDKWRLARACEGAVRVPHTVLYEAGPGFTGEYPVVAKPRQGSGSRGIVLARGPEDLVPLPQDGSYLLQEELPGAEYSVDVLARADGHVVAAVPRSREKTDSGIAVAGRVLDGPGLSKLAAGVVRTLGVRGIANVQVREDRTGTPALLEINPRPPGGLSMTIAAGVHMPAWALADVLGLPVPDALPHRELDVVRHWEDVLLPAGGLGEVGERA
ncbi:ATP-grasp domain-containing protein [Streptomyces sp. ODS28]|uniref:ATP-grasp domain-containing protein n=1 Tax=Streptomyces sp. ODS28 TaxID=3136688 RepID=UPI0031EFCD16